MNVYKCIIRNVVLFLHKILNNTNIHTYYIKLYHTQLFMSVDYKQLSHWITNTANRIEYFLTGN